MLDIFKNTYDFFFTATSNFLAWFIGAAIGISLPVFILLIALVVVVCFALALSLLIARPEGGDE